MRCDYTLAVQSLARCRNRSLCVVDLEHSIRHPVFCACRFSNSGRNCGYSGIANPDLVLCRNVVICSRCQSMSSHVSADASACPNPASPINSTKSADSSASCPLNTCDRMLSTIAWNCSKVGVFRIGLSSLNLFEIRCRGMSNDPVTDRHCQNVLEARKVKIARHWRRICTGPTKD